MLKLQNDKNNCPCQCSLFFHPTESWAWITQHDYEARHSVVLQINFDNLESLNVRLNLSAQAFYHFAHIKIRPPLPGIEPATLCLAVKSNSCQATTLGNPRPLQYMHKRNY